MTRLLPVPLPSSGAVRVHPAPEVLPQLRHEGPGRNRFDDPHGSFLMRYTAENLRGSLVETMARFRPNSTADALLASVQFVEPDADPPAPTAQAVADWLAEQRVGQVTLVTQHPLLIDIEAADLLVDLDSPAGTGGHRQLPAQRWCCPSSSRRGTYSAWRGCRSPHYAGRLSRNA